MLKKKVLIFFSVGIGDALMTTPALQAMQTLRQDYQIDALFMNKSVADLFHRCDWFDHIHQINFLTGSKPAAIRNVLRLRSQRYHKSIMIFPANHYLYQLVTFTIGAKERYGHRYLQGAFPDFQFLYNRSITEDRTLHCVEENFRLFEKSFGVKLSRDFNLSIPVGKAEQEFARLYLQKHNLEQHNLIGIHAGCDVLKNMIHKRWSAANYGNLIKRISATQNQTRFLLFGGSAESELNREIAAYLPDKTQVVEKTSFLESAALMQQCRLFIANDSGLMHTAAALQLPVLAIFGPTNPTYLHPYRSEHEIVQKNISCQPCFEYARRPLICNQQQKYRCIRELSVEEVFAKFQTLNNRIQ